LGVGLSASFRFGCAVLQGLWVLGGVRVRFRDVVEVRGSVDVDGGGDEGHIADHDGRDRVLARKRGWVVGWGMTKVVDFFEWWGMGVVVGCGGGLGVGGVLTRLDKNGDVWFFFLIVPSCVALVEDACSVMSEPCSALGAIASDCG
jgi:hypothetical protein